MAPFSRMNVRLEPLLNFRELEKVNRFVTPVAFCLSPIYGCSPYQFLWKYAPLLTFIGGMIYKADDELEAAQRGDSPFDGIAPWLPRNQRIKELLAELGIRDPRAEALLDDVGTYWELENQLNYHGVITRELLDKTISLRSCDLLALHHLCLHLAEVPDRDAIFEAMIPWQIHTEMIMDLIEYPKDVADGSYNTYRMFVKLYGSSAPSQLAAHMSRYAELTEEQLRKLTASTQETLRRAFKAAVDDLGELPQIPEPVLQEPAQRSSRSAGSAWRR